MASYLSYPAINTEIFPKDYSAARLKLLTQLAGLLQSKHHTYICPGTTPNSDNLYSDAIWLGSEDAANVLVLLGGTHGVEGFVGSAVELDHLNLIRNNVFSLPKNTAMLIVHALTPWGYAWLRRCDEDGVDLNRNYVNFNQSLPQNSGYEQLKSALFSDDCYQRQAIFTEFKKVHGKVEFEVAISGGQYMDALGPFFGGKKAAHGRLVTEDLMRKYSLAQRNLAVIDLHSGLGAYGYGEIICDHATNSLGVDIARKWYGNSATFPALGTSSSVPKLGLMDYAWHDIMSAQSCHITLEFGSYPTSQLFEVLMRDHQLWAKPDNVQQRVAHSLNMRQHFCPDDNAWKALVLFRARQVIYQALKGLSPHD